MSLEDLKFYFKAGTPAIYIRTCGGEEPIALASVFNAAKGIYNTKYRWTITDGLVEVSEQDDSLKSITKSPDLVEAMDRAIELKKTADSPLFIWIDHNRAGLDRDPVVHRKLKELIGKNVSSVFISPDWQLEDGTFNKMVITLDCDLPQNGTLKNWVNISLDSVGFPDAKKEVTDEILNSLRGLTSKQITEILAFCLVSHGGTLDARFIAEEKMRQICQHPALSLAEPGNPDEIGGLRVLKKWIIQRKNIFTPEAAKYGLPRPKGILLIGPPGTGKSATAKAIGSTLGLPVLRMDVGDLHASLVGETERLTREAFAVADSLSPVVVWIDEIEKFFGQGQGDLDSGVGSRMKGKFLTWMQERKSSVFLVATCNNINALPLEMRRAGRWDCIFFIDLPNKEEREEIVKIHITKVKRNPNKFDIPRLVQLTEKFTGAEIEQAIKDGLVSSFHDGAREPSMEDMTKAICGTKPLAETSREELEAMRRIAKDRYVLASEEQAVSKAPERKLSV